METLNAAALLLTLAAVFSYLNHRFIRLPTTIGIMLIAIVMSLALILLDWLRVADVYRYACSLFRSVDFNQTLLHGMLSFLLFAGALQINLDDLARNKWVIAILSTAGVAISTLVIGALAWLVFGLVGVAMPFLYLLLFGALIAPTDPVAVLGILKTADIPKSLETKIAGESLFNDGMAVVVFLLVYGMATGGGATFASLALLFVREVGGGIAFGLAAGWLCYRMLKSVDNYQVEILLTLALVMGGYALADALHLSGPIAIVVAGLLIGNRGRYLAMSQRTREHLDSFWELTDEFLNAILFLLIGLEIMVVAISLPIVVAGLLIIPAVLLARFVSVGLPILLMKPFVRFSPNIVRIMTWGGLRGGISVALALSLPSGAEREALLTVTYMVVVFSILVQGLTLKPLFAPRPKSRA
ncbi:MAG: sodium:proton antiporter [Candidatus Aminicenantes bacterium]|nr:sodium:proton antiporter [Candidatus Aminicenantes bacterium]